LERNAELDGENQASSIARSDN